MTIDAVEGIVRDALAEVSNLPASADAAADLYLDLGVPSVQALALLRELEERLDVSVPDERFVQATTIAALASALHELVSARV